ncbi:bifunctional acetaldehyde-CoA/alcohol dehydrogenase [Oceanivirga miroungae]|uniref:Aldehyde-alcohol dehydrogenase n=2 Tax=Oceanivirga miroungae TaxID=1130046 RepID=A0A6I8M7V6_9FUSO|nr:bifunctional acetaldehyde-CoA/alcohol dehydrogenase [Oceanivirga miroungae]VWL85580.1 Listeria adhesion protein Lap [Oceanivirga miroungae]
MVKDIKTLNELMKKVRKSQEEYSKFNQEQVDKIFRKVAQRINNERITLSKLAVEETGMGVLEDKVIKNHFASEYIYNKYKDEKTCGVLEDDRAYGIKKIATPIGIVAGVIPTTNPTSTAAFKILLALKTRNAIIISPHPRAKKSTIYTAKIALEEAIKYGAPENIIGWIDEPSLDISRELMAESDLILATGGPGMVKSAYSSGTPAIGVGSGNTPVIIDESAHIKMTVNYILMSKSFDNGVICASEQSVIVPRRIYERVKEEFQKRGAYILNAEETDKIRKVLFKEGTTSINADIVGQSAYKIAQIAGFEIPKDKRVIIAEIDSTDVSEPLAHEKLSPILAMYKSKDFNDSLEKAKTLVELGGLGHTSSLYIDLSEKAKIDIFGEAMKTGRTLINMPAALGAIGDVFNFKLAPSLTLGCGSWGGNSVSENVGVKHLLNVKTIAERRENMLWFKVPEKIYFKFGCLPEALEELKGSYKKAMIVTDRTLAELGYANHVTQVLEKVGIDYRIFSEVGVDPTLSATQAGARAMQEYQPDLIIAIGGGSAMDAAKIMWVLYEHPEIRFKDIAMRFMDIRKRIVKFPKMGKKAYFVAVATSAGTGSEVTPFSVITDDTSEQSVKYPLADYELTPDMAINDPELMLSMPKGLTVASGMDVLTHAIESYVSIMATEYTKPYSLEAMKIVFDYLPESVALGPKAIKAKEKMSNASCIAGIAFSNAFLGIVHSLSHKLGNQFHLAHGMCNAMLLTEVIKYNATDAPFKMGVFPQYKYPDARNRYAKIADFLNLGGNTVDEKIEKLCETVEELKARIGVPKTIREAGVKEEDFLAAVDEMALEAFDDQCTPANPRYPLISELKEIYLKCYYGADEYEKKFNKKGE